MIEKKQQAKFELGEEVCTPAAIATFGPEFLTESLTRHSQGDWGDIPEADKRTNELALDGAGSLFSAYKAEGIKPKLWIITSPDRESTTALLPEEY